jgi:hypothetical protein
VLVSVASNIGLVRRLAPEYPREEGGGSPAVRDEEVRPMDIGRPKRVIEIEPVSIPVPEHVPIPEPVNEPEAEPAEPVPAEPGHP